MRRANPMTKSLVLLLLALTLFITSAFLPFENCPQNFSFRFHVVSSLNVVGQEGSDLNNSAVSFSLSSIHTENVTPVTLNYECQKTSSEEETTNDRLTVQGIQSRRRAQLENVCASEMGNSQSTELKRKHFLVDRKRKILYCWIHKVASTSWISFMAQLRGLRVKTKKIYRQIGRMSASSVEEVRSASRDYRVRFIVVRHPFRRLISAYRDRIWAATRKYSAQAWTHVPRIFRLTRPTQYQYMPSKSIMHNNGRTLAVVPTFEEFVRYLLLTANGNYSKDVNQYNMTSASAFDVHWIPYHQHCSVCSIPYNIIIKLETIDEDKNYLMEELGLWPTGMRIEQMDECNNSSIHTEKGNASTSSTKLSSVEGSYSGLNASRNNDVSEFTRHAVSPQVTRRECVSNRTEDPIPVGSQVKTTPLHHFQVSSIGPSCPCYYFSQLTSDQISGLTKIYDKDLKIFGYSTEEYNSCLMHKI